MSTGKSSFSRPFLLYVPSYLLPRATWPCLFLESLRLPYLHIEDVFVSGFSAARCGFPRRHFDGFHCGLFPVMGGPGRSRPFSTWVRRQSVP